MKMIFKSFLGFLKEIWDDIMLCALIVVPVIIGLVFKFLVPLLESFICSQMGRAEFLSPYYILFDLMIIFVTPIMFSFSGVMVILEELDNGIAKYLSVTPLGKTGYLISRIGIMSVISCFYAIIVTTIFRISDISFINIVLSCVLSMFIGILISFFIVTVAHNKVEGMALSKFSSFLLIGLFISVFVKNGVKYIASFLPTFWIMEFINNNNAIFYLLSVLICLVYIYLFYRKFDRKLT